ncbi:MAG: lysylphosphatidylglycerol synthase transmembrane domain-containing protein [Actinomycetota bacterium]
MLEEPFRTTEEVTTEMAIRARRSSRGLVVRRGAQIVLAAVVVIGIYAFGLPRIAEFSDVWFAIRQMTWLEVTTLTILAFWNLFTYWLVEVASFPGLNYWQAMKVVSTSTAIANTMPGGGAFGLATTTAMYRSYGFTNSQIASCIVTQGAWNNFVKLGMPVIALALLALSGTANAGLLAASIVGVALLVFAIVLFTLTLRSERTARAVARRAGRIVASVRGMFGRARDGDTVADGILRFRSETRQLVKARWLRLTGTVLVSHVSLYLLLLVALRHVGVGESAVGWIEALAAFAFVRLISALPITPGGVGVVELGLTAALVAAGGPDAGVIAAVLVFRALSYLLPIAFGGITYIYWRKGATRRRARLELKGAQS